eukprot:797904-Pleurochrysis_carterae.AAC.1
MPLSPCARAPHMRHAPLALPQLIVQIYQVHSPAIDLVHAWLWGGDAMVGSGAVCVGGVPHLLVLLTREHGAR